MRAMDAAPLAKRARTSAAEEEGEIAEPLAAPPPAPPPATPCKHEVVLPPGAATDAERTALAIPAAFDDAISFPFALDPFQQKALAAVDLGDSVLVSAHTSAGKTVVAQYAIALSLKRGQRVVYTSPIKALSNQKYRELHAQFGGDVGLMTGDVNVNVDASCIVMTTEILRNMLYKGSELVREVQWVIFDEVHYMRDKERGVIWEECIILLPSAVRFVFLSATVPNGREFAEWVAATHSLPCHVVTTPHRPTPLQHWVYPVGGDGVHLLLDQHGKFHPANLDAALSCLRDAEARAASARLGSRHSPELLKVIKMLMARELLPAIVFSFSRKECEGAAMCAKSLPPLGDEQLEAVRAVFDAAIATLSSDDQRIKQVSAMLPLLERGVAVHHSGVLPVLREVVEILFQEGLVRLLFATETFSMGVNMPARTVLFTSMRKWDGSLFRPPSAAEYIQMSGRAGRRGIDDKGFVLLLLQEEVEQQQLLSMMQGAALPLTSSFQLRFNTLLRLYGMETLQPEALVRKSFYAFQRAAALPALAARKAELLDAATALKRPGDEGAAAILDARASRRRLEDHAHSMALASRFSLRFLQPGRLAHVRLPAVGGAERGSSERGWGVVLGFRHEHNAPLGQAPPQGWPREQVLVDVLLPCAAGAATSECQPAAAELCEPTAELHVLTVRLSCVSRLSSARLWLPTDLTSPRARHVALQAMRQLLADPEPPPAGPEPAAANGSHAADGGTAAAGGAADAADGALRPSTSNPRAVTTSDLRPSIGRLNGQRRLEAACLHPTRDLGASCVPACAEAVAQAEALYLKEEELSASLTAADGDGDGEGLEARLSRLLRMRELERQAAECGKEAVGLSADDFGERILKMQRVLKRLGYVDGENVVQLKGRAAAEIEAADELLVSEMLLGGVFADLQPAAAVALCSCFIAADSEKVKRPPALHADLAPAHEALVAAAKTLAAVMGDAGIETDEAEYVARFDSGLMNVCYAWCNGSSFEELCGMVELFEGSIVRAIRRLSELLDELQSAAKAIGNDELYHKLDSGAKLIRRDIVFAASLYIEG